MQASSPVVLKIKQNVQREQVWDSKINNMVFGFNQLTPKINGYLDLLKLKIISTMMVMKFTMILIHFLSNLVHRFSIFH
jgi:hypothetical protein